MVDRWAPISTAVSVDDCWNRIGVYGDRSCARLDEHLHCRNCEVHAEAAVRLLDHFALQQQDEQLADELEQVDTCSLLLFRLGDEWLALATGSLVEVIPMAAVHSLPHQRSRSLLGVTNVRGALVACFALGEVLGINLAAAAVGDSRVVPRMLILEGQGGPVVVAVDEVEGIQDIPVASIKPAGHASGLALGQFAAGVLQWRERGVTLIDAELLRQALHRSFI